MKVLGICPIQDAEDNLDSVCEQPLGIAYVMSAAQKAGHEVQLKYNYPPVTWALPYDVIAISAMTKDVPRALKFAKEIRKISPRIKIIIGGHHVSGSPNIVLNSAVDYAVIGEGEETFVELLSALEKGGDISLIKGVSFEKQGKVYQTLGKRALLELDGLRPIRDNAFYEKRSSSFYFPPPSERRDISFIISRGCTKKCEFCTSELVWEGTIRYRGLEDALSEADELVTDPKRDILLIDDENFFHTPSKAKELLKQFAKRNYNLASCGDIRAMNENIADLMQAAGFTAVYWGIESINQAVLTREKPGLTVNQIGTTLTMFDKRGISNIGMVMIGFDYETEKDILRYAHELQYYPLHQLRLAIATPFPGTPFWHRLRKQGISFDPDFSKYDTTHLVYEHPEISPDRMRELARDIVSKFYKSSRWNQRLQRMAGQHPKLKRSVEEFRDYISRSYNN
jgi:anaerobic magnesium-protoporphyrin IX monomethyl ester cyclase